MFPAREQIVQQLSVQHQNVDEIVEWLIGPHAKTFLGDTPIALLRVRSDGGLEALV